MNQSPLTLFGQAAASLERLKILDEAAFMAILDCRKRARDAMWHSFREDISHQEMLSENHALIGYCLCAAEAIDQLVQSTSSFNEVQVQTMQEIRSGLLERAKDKESNNTAEAILYHKIKNMRQKNKEGEEWKDR